MAPAPAHDEYSVVTEFYDYVVPYRNRNDIGFFVEMARQSEGAVLEIGCGTGRVLIPIAKVGVNIVGLDLSPSMLAFCREKLSCEPEEVRSRVQLLQADMRRFDLGREFSLVITPFRPFQHLLTIEDQLSCLTSIRRHLAGDGRLVLDLYNPDLSRLIDEKFLGTWNEEPEFTMPDGRKVIRRTRVVSRDLFNQINDFELVHHVTHPDGSEDQLGARFRLRYCFRFEAEHLLARAGFRVEQVYADYDKSAYGSKYPGEMIFVAKKR
ncbi:MAG: class I SAM-dependent methyltransferase [Candidatus Hydrogenedentota bacterium]|nr:MAG: class I SAM-dependent methyltransferase [Candidatus Hydrogenedentota bacterium]